MHKSPGFIIKRSASYTQLTIIYTILLLLCLNWSSTSISFVQSFEYGDNCTDTCNESPIVNETWLQCNNETKLCECQTGMTINKDKMSKCVSLIGQPCQQDDLTKPLRNCIDDAVCVVPDDPTNKSSLCQCKSNYIPLPTNLGCRLGPGGSCERTEDCSLNALLSCQNGNCHCDQSLTQIWDPIQSKCVSLVGGSCNDHDSAFIKRPCIQGSSCNNVTMKCECEAENFKETPDKRCLLSYGKTCTEKNDCHPHYECISGQDNSKNCNCDTNNSVYDKETQLCAIYAGKPCTPSSFSSSNIGNSFCVERSTCSERYKTCTCESDFIQSTSGHCVGGYRADCNLPTDKCDDESHFECNNATSQCDCKSNYFYNSEARKCIGYVGTSCAQDSDCYALAECSSTSKTCQCRNGYSPSPDSKCLVAYGNYCSGIPGQCNEYDFLSCDVTTKSCTCENNAEMIYNSNVLKCVGLPGSKCYVVEIGGRKLGCTANATCSRIDSTNEIGQCICNEGMENVGGHCGVKSNNGNRLGMLKNIFVIPELLLLALLVLIKDW